MTLTLEQFKEQYTDYDLSGLTDAELSKLKGFQESLDGNIAFSPKPNHDPFDRILHKIWYGTYEDLTEESHSQQFVTELSPSSDKDYEDPLINSAARGMAESLSGYTQRRSDEFITYFLTDVMD